MLNVLDLAPKQGARGSEGDVIDVGLPATATETPAGRAVGISQQADARSFCSIFADRSEDGGAGSGRRGGEGAPGGSGVQVALTMYSSWCKSCSFSGASMIIALAFRSSHGCVRTDGCLLAPRVNFVTYLQNIGINHVREPCLTLCRNCHS